MTEQIPWTLFATPRGFLGHFDMIQQNALQSWLHLQPRPEVILFGNEVGTEEVARAFGIRHVPAMACREDGSPLLSLFEEAQRIATHDVLCYVNADVMLLPDIISAADHLRVFRRPCLMVGRVWRVRLDRLWDFSDPEWVTHLRAFVRACGLQAPLPGNSDYFLFPRGCWTGMPPLALGKGWWDAWLIYEARRRGLQVIDTSERVMAVHQNHDQSSYPFGLRRWRQEVDRNLALVGATASRFTLLDATHLMDRNGLHRAAGIRYRLRQVETWPLWHPRLGWLMGLPLGLLRFARRMKALASLATDPACRWCAQIARRLPSGGVTSIVGLAPSRSHTGLGEAFGIQLARKLLGGGFPVIVYDPDPDRMGRAKTLLSGPVEWAPSAEVCRERGDVVVTTTASGSQMRSAHGSGRDMQRWGELMRRDWDERARRDAFHYIASQAETWHPDEFFQSGEQDYRILVEPVLRQFQRQPSEEVMLELGSGVGRMTGSLARRFRAVCALDVSSEMLKRGRQFHAEKTNIWWVQGDGKGLPLFKEATFDCVLSYLVMQHLPSKALALGYLQEMLRVLKPGGLFLVQFNSQRHPSMNWKGRLVWGMVDRLGAARLGIPAWRSSRRVARLAGLDPLTAGKTWRGVVLDVQEARAAIRGGGGEVAHLMGAGTSSTWCAGLKVSPGSRTALTIVLGRRDAPTDALGDYARCLAEALRPLGRDAQLRGVSWDKGGWSKALWQLWTEAADWRAQWVLVQYTALAWSRRGFPLGLVAVMVILKWHGARLAMVFHDNAPFLGRGLVGRARRWCQFAVMTVAYRLAERVVFTIEVARVPWVPRGDQKSSFIPVGSNILPPANGNGLPRGASRRTGRVVTMFGITEGERGLAEMVTVAGILSRVSPWVPGAHLVAVGRGVEGVLAALRDRLAEAGVSVAGHGVVPAAEISRLLGETDVVMDIRDEISTKRGSVMAAIAHGLPVVGFEGPATGFPVTEAGVCLAPAGDVERLSQLVIEVLTAVSWREQLCQRSRNAYQRHFAWDVIAEQYRRVCPMSR